MPWLYFQRSGELLDPNGKLAGVGYSGFGEGKNRPEMEHVKAIGPIPRATYRIGAPYNSDNVGPYALTLATDEKIHGRTALRIHGDNGKGTASHGCIILPRPLREAIWESGDHTLIVKEGRK